MNLHCVIAERYLSSSWRQQYEVVEFEFPYQTYLYEVMLEANNMVNCGQNVGSPHALPIPRGKPQKNFPSASGPAMKSVVLKVRRGNRIVRSADCTVTLRRTVIWGKYLKNKCVQRPWHVITTDMGTLLLFWLVVSINVIYPNRPIRECHHLNSSVMRVSTPD